MERKGRERILSVKIMRALIVVILSVIFGKFLLLSLHIFPTGAAGCRSGEKRFEAEASEGGTKATITSN